MTSSDFNTSDEYMHLSAYAIGHYARRSWDRL